MVITVNMKQLTGFLALFLFASLALYAADLSDLTITTSGGQVTITHFDGGATGELFISDTIQGNPVTSIGDESFSRCWGLTSITISNGVSSIGSSAFSGCTALTRITLRGNAPTFGWDVFLNLATGARAYENVSW